LDSQRGGVQLTHIHSFIRQDRTVGRSTARCEAREVDLRLAASPGQKHVPETSRNRVQRKMFSSARTSGNLNLLEQPFIARKRPDIEPSFSYLLALALIAIERYLVIVL